MTLKEEAHRLIDELPDDIDLMTEIVNELEYKAHVLSVVDFPGRDRFNKGNALASLKSLRRDAKKFGSLDFAIAREEAMTEKFGDWII